jgi:hypothetical protein
MEAIETVSPNNQKAIATGQFMPSTQFPIRWRNMGQEKAGEPGIGSMRVLTALSGRCGRLWARETR